MTKHKRAGRIPEHLRDRVSLSVAPWDWLSKARQLRRAADLLFISFEAEQEKYDRNPSDDAPIPDDSALVLLIGFAVENLLKGLYVTKCQTNKIKNMNAPNIPGSGHQLLPIIEELQGSPLSFTFSTEERDILDVLEHTVLWSGRYPSARDIDDLIPMNEGGGFKKFYFHYPQDYFAALRLFDRIESALADRAQAPAKSDPFGLP